MIKVVITGPESSGKTTLTASLAAHFQMPWLSEYARTYIERLDRPYQEEDLLNIAEGQMRQEDEAAQQHPLLLLCDTSLLVIKIWSDYRYGRCHPWIAQQWAQRPVDHYLLCRPDLPWESDPQRENPHNRDELFHRYQQALHTRPYTIVEGPRDHRLRVAIEAIDRLVNQ